MAYSLQNTTDLSNLADAIRAKTGGSSNMTVADMATAVASIAGSGGTVTISYTSPSVSTNYYTGFTSLTLTGDASKNNIWIIPIIAGDTAGNHNTGANVLRYMSYPALLIKQPNSNPELKLMSGAQADINSPWYPKPTVSASGNNVTITFSKKKYSGYDSNRMWYIQF